MRRIELPASLAFGTAERLHRLGVIPAPASDLQYVVHPWVVPSTRLHEAGWRPAYDNVTALGLLLEQARGHHALGGPAGRPAGRDHRRGRCGRGCHRHRRAGPGGPAEAAVVTVDAAGVIRLLGVREEPLSVDEVFAAVSDPAAGGIALFVGTVREQDGGRGVAGLGYSAHPSGSTTCCAGRPRRSAPRTRSARSPPCTGSATWRSATSPSSWACPARTGARRSRPAAMLIDELKSAVPIWKHQVFADGSTSGSGCPESRLAWAACPRSSGSRSRWWPWCSPCCG